MNFANSKKLVSVFATIFFLILGVVLVLSNGIDWDHFLAVFEAEFRSWVIDGKPPLWTYQICAGSTRIGDPQAFGLSPLFLPVLLLGSFWGAKVLVLLCMLIGYWYLPRLLEMIVSAGAGASEDLKIFFKAISLFFLFGNFLFWHFQHGHMTFALLPFVFLPLYCAARIFYRGFELKSAVLFLLAGFSYCTAGFYHSAVFFVFPLLMIGVFSFVLPVFLRSSPSLPKRDVLYRIIILIVLGLLVLAFSSYKWWAVFAYQREFPRTLAIQAPEITNPFYIILYLLLPTWNFKFFGLTDGWDFWGIHEYSSFSALAWLLILMFSWAIWKSRNSNFGFSWKDSWGAQFALAFFIFFLLCLGDAYPFSLNRLLNAYIYRDSLRVVGRYQGVLLFFLALFLARIVYINEKCRTFFKTTLLPVGLLLALMGNLTFLTTINIKTFWKILDTPASPVARMSTIVTVPPRAIALHGESFMYGAVKMGAIVLNCYQPLAREERIGGETWRSDVLPSTPVIDLLSEGAMSLETTCRESAYVTQNDVFFDPADCPKDICFRLNMLNIYRPKSLHWNMERRMFCRDASEKDSS